jgi:hypothetical protein
MMKKNPTPRVKLLPEATGNSKLGKTKTNKKPKTCCMNKSASLTLVQGPSTVVCTIVT